MLGSDAENSKRRVVDLPTLEKNSSGLTFARRPAKLQVKEAVWLQELTDRYDGWRELVSMREATAIDHECPIAPYEIGARYLWSCALGRADAIVRHDDGAISIIEAKVTSSPRDFCGGIGQLVYYKTLAEKYWEVEVAALLLVVPWIPPFALETIANIQAPIRILKRDSEDYLSGLVPDYA